MIQLRVMPLSVLLSTIILLWLSSFAYAQTVTYLFNPTTLWLAEETFYTPETLQQSWVDAYTLTRSAGDISAPATNGTVSIEFNQEGGAGMESMTVDTPNVNLNGIWTSFNPSFILDENLTPIQTVTDWSLNFTSIPSAPAGYVFDRFEITSSGESFRGDTEVYFTGQSGTTSTGVGSYSEWPSEIFADPWLGETADPGSSTSSRLGIRVVYRTPEPSAALLVSMLASTSLVLRRRK